MQNHNECNLRQEQPNLWEQFCADMAPVDSRDWNDVRIEICLAFRPLRQEAHAAYCEWEREMDV